MLRVCSILKKQNSLSSFFVFHVFREYRNTSLFNKTTQRTIDADKRKVQIV